MQFAIAIPTDADSWRVVRRAEELGFARAWFYDTQMLSADPFVAMAAAAIKTTKIRHRRADPIEPHRSGYCERLCIAE
jgi:5,10-methylenetetrahydromethanopterin reductase